MRRFSRAIAALALAGVACSSSGAATRAQSAPTASPAPAAVELPKQILGLSVVREDITDQVKTVEDAYIDSLALFGFRQKKVLRAALQVSHFNSLARLDDPSFRRRIVAQVGSTVPTEIRVGDQTIAMTAGKLQYTFLWFSDRWMYVLTVRRDYKFARTLLRRLVEETTQ